MPLLWLVEAMFAVAPSPHLPAKTLKVEVTPSYFLHYLWAMWEGDGSLNNPNLPLNFPPVQAAHCHLSFPYCSAQP